MKKIIALFLIVLFAFIPAYSQESESQEPEEYSRVMATIGFTYANNIMGSNEYQHSFMSDSYLMNGGLMFLIGINENIYARINTDILFGYYEESINAMPDFGFGIQLSNTNHPYVFMTVHPRLNVMGIGHQQYGDYAVFWLQFCAGFGYEYRFDHNNSIYLEVGVSSDLTLYVAEELANRTPNPVQPKNNVGMFATIGYHFTI